MEKQITEEQLQAQCFIWFWNTFPGQRQMLYAVNNNSVNRIEGNRHKSIGVVAGVADLTFVHMGGVTFIELKVGKNVQSAEQIMFQLKVEIR